MYIYMNTIYEYIYHIYMNYSEASLTPPSASKFEILQKRFLAVNYC